MKTFTTFLLLFCASLANAQFTQVPDPEFEQYLIDNGFDSTGILDGQVPTADIANFDDQLDIVGDNYNITDLTGIEDFASVELIGLFRTQCTIIDFGDLQNLIGLFAGSNSSLQTIDISGCQSLQTLVVNSNALTTLDITQNPNLSSVDCSQNNLTELDTSMTTNLSGLGCADNMITSLDFTENTELRGVGCSGNPLMSLDLSENMLLDGFNCDDSPLLETIDIRNGNNTNFDELTATNNPNLTCFFVDDVAYAEANFTEVDPNATFVETDAECQTLGVPEQERLLDVRLFPNPAQDYFYVMTGKVVKQVKVYSLSGKLVKSYTDQFGRYEVSGLSAGIYFVEVFSDSGKGQEKLVIQ